MPERGKRELRRRTFDAYTIAFGIRNVTHIDRALRRGAARAAPGGRFFCLEFSTVEWPGLKEAYDALLRTSAAAHGAGDRGGRGQLSLPRRIDPQVPADAAFEAMIRAAGFAQTKVEPIMGGLVAIHS
jgi:demethylmenaquinone methyltransferase/2-methoxy-6-polyprenyl-1,4-benzoquinol methylase